MHNNRVAALLAFLSGGIFIVAGIVLYARFPWLIVMGLFDLVVAAFMLRRGRSPGA